MESANIWLDEKLQPKGYIIFRGNLQSYSSNVNLFAFGFMSPFQKDRLATVNTYCLDATYSITKRADDILYTLVIRDPHLGRGFPCGYMVTNDHSLGPIVQWLQFLKEESVIVNPLQFTIDCSDSETNAINNIFPDCSIQYCLFHVSQAWNRQLALKVKAVSRVPAENRVLRSEVHTYLKMILYEADKDLFHARIEEFIHRYEDSQPAFINYFRSNWCNEAKYNLWSRAYHPIEFSHMLTNNYIESWHNQLKSIFLRRSRNKRLDRLIFVLSVEVEYFYHEEFDRVEVNHGPMTPAEKERRRVRLAAEAVPEDRRIEMITGPSGSNEHADFDNVAVSVSGDWIVDSFIDENGAYVVSVDEDKTVKSCTCYYFRKNQSNCKHMHLLCLQVSEFSLCTIASLNSLPLLAEDTAVASSSNLAESDIPASSAPIPSLAQAPSLSAILSRSSDCISMMYHARNDLLSMTYMDYEEGQRALENLESSLRMIQGLKDKYSSHFRTLNTQR
jgi:hypothetical protein